MLPEKRQIVCVGDLAWNTLARMDIPTHFVAVPSTEEGMVGPNCVFVVSPEVSIDSLSPEIRQELQQSPVFHFSSSAELAERAHLLKPCDELCLWPALEPLFEHRWMRFLSQLPEIQPTDGRGPDHLTGLANRPQFVADIQSLLSTFEPSDKVSLLLIDLDYFKNLNDTYGHLVGDDTLRQIAELLRRHQTESSCVGRIGGEEFSLFLKAGQTEAFQLAEQIRCALQTEGITIQESDDQSRRAEMTLCVGISTSSAEDATYELLMGEADKAMYAAKARGRNQCCHIVTMEQIAIDKNSNLQLESFENMVRVLSERVSDALVRRGRRMIDEMRDQAERDVLTGLYSRRYFNNRLEFEFEDATEKKSSITVALLDVDYFGQVNKSHGWPSGDKVLADVATMIKDSIRHDDWVARYGGEEFCIVMQSTTLEQADQVLERIRINIEEAQFTSTSETPLAVTVSIGATSLSPEDASSNEIIERASQLLLEAKNSGRNRVISG